MAHFIISVCSIHVHAAGDCHSRDPLWFHCPKLKGSQTLPANWRKCSSLPCLLCCVVLCTFLCKLLFWAGILNHSWVGPARWMSGSCVPNLSLSVGSKTLAVYPCKGHWHINTSLAICHCPVNPNTWVFIRECGQGLVPAGTPWTNLMRCSSLTLMVLWNSRAGDCPYMMLLTLRSDLFALAQPPTCLSKFRSVKKQFLVLWWHCHQWRR